ncbi:MAG: hypothetical protein K2U26_08250 [Cyclobacteriaceae bacterium]|nr:hypothetical protein [Cyclobacteriaceae bacterium]
MFRDRNHAAHLLTERLMSYKDTDSVVVAIPRGGVPVGIHIAKELHLSLDIIPSQRIKNPALANETIGSVSINGLDIAEDCHDIPQDFIYHQVVMIKHRLMDRYKFYRGEDWTADVKDKTVFLVDDKLECVNQLLACIRSVNNQQPKRLVVAAPIISTEVLRKLLNIDCDVVYLISTSQADLSKVFYEYLPPVSDDEVRKMLQEFKEQSAITDQ